MPALLDERVPYQKQAPKRSPFASKPKPQPRPITPKPIAAPAQAIPPEAQRLQDLNLAELQAQRQQISDDLARQLGQITQQQQWQQEEINKRIGQIETDAPEQQGRLGSSFAARGSYSSGARQEAEKDLMEQFARQIEGMRTGLEKERQVADWEKEKLNIAAQRGFSDLARRQEAQELEWSMQKQRVAEGSGRQEANRFTYARMNGWLDGRVSMLRSQGKSLADATSQAIVEARQEFPGLDETDYYRATTPGAWDQKQVKRWGIYDISADRGRDITPQKQATLRGKPAYAGIRDQALNFFSQTGGQGTDKDFVKWWAKKFPKTVSNLTKNPQLVSVVLMDLRYGG